MNAKTYELELLTPCLCAGADQARAEIRAPAIRGQLRWWFRVLGGTASEEAEVFGSVTGQARASALTIRVINSQLSLNKSPVLVKRELSPGTPFSFQVIQTRHLPRPLENKFAQVLRVFLCLGGLGRRVTRGRGSFHCPKEGFHREIKEILEGAGFRCVPPDRRYKNHFEIIDAIDKHVNEMGKGNHRCLGKLSVLGSANPRQTSAVYFRPIRSPQAPGCLELVIFEAPHSRVLDRRIADAPFVLGA